MINKIKKFIIRIFNPINNVFFVGSTDKLPEPLTKDEETDLVIRNMNGDIDAKNKLIEHNLR